MAKQKHYYYVQVLVSRGRYAFVTEIRDHKVAVWSDKGTPLAMEKWMAEDIVTGLLLNFTTAVIVDSILPIGNRDGINFVDKIDRDINDDNIWEFEKFMRDTIDDKYTLEYDKEKGVVNVGYDGKPFRTVNVSGDSFLGCVRDVMKRIE